MKAAQRWIYGLAWLPPLAGLAWLAGLTAWLCVRALGYPYQLLHGEGVMLEFSRRLLAGEPVYKPLADFPPGTCNYAPLPLLLARLSFPLAGVGFAAGRVWAVLATLAIAVLLFAWVRRAAGQRPAALAVALAWLGAPYVYHWAPQFRVDLPGLALSLAGIYLVWRVVAGGLYHKGHKGHEGNRASARAAPGDMAGENAYARAGSQSGSGAAADCDPARAEDGDPRRAERWDPRRAGGDQGRKGSTQVGWRPGREELWLLAAALLMVLGLYCKQSFLAAPAAACLYLLVRRRRQGLLLAAALAVLGGVPFLVLNLTTRGAFWYSLLSANVNPFDLRLLLSQVWDLVRSYWPLLVLVAAWLWPRGARPAVGQGLIGLYVALALLSGGLAGKVGSWENYFLEPLAALCLGAGLGLARLLALPSGSPRAALRWLAPLLLLAQAATMWHTPALAARVMRDDALANRELIPTVAAAPGLVLAEDMGLLVLAGKPVPYYDFQLSQLALAGRWDQSWEVDRLERGAFDLVIFEGDTRLNVEQYGRYTRAFVSALDYGYRPAGSVGKYRLYRPAPPDRDRPVALAGGLALAAYTLPPAEAAPGERLTLDVVWQASGPIGQDYTSFVHLVDAAGQRVAGDDHAPWNGLYPTSGWAPAERVRQSYTLTLPAEMPPGLYTVRTGWYDAALNRLSAESGADSLPLAVVRVPPGEAGPAYDLTPLDARFQRVRLAGSYLERAGDRLSIVLSWQPEAWLDTDYAVFIHLRGPAGETAAQADGPPAGGQWPTSLWRPGTAVEDAHRLSLPPDPPPGTYRVVVGLYDPASGARLPLAAGGDEVVVGEIEVTE